MSDQPIIVTIDELTFEFTPAQATAIRAYASRCEREFLRALTEKIAMGELKQMFTPVRPASMGKDIDLADDSDLEAGGHGLHTYFMDDLKNQLLIVLLKRLTIDGNLSVPVAEINDADQDRVAFSVRDRVFHFEVRKKC